MIFSRSEFRRSSYSDPNGNNCVEVARSSGLVGIRDSKADDAVLLVSPAAFSRFLAVVRRGPDAS
jgi:hypothetical protein